jgi:hypothetical protein
MINEFDIEDWVKLEPKPLYNVPRNSPIQLNEDMYWFDHLDGMYSVCYRIFAGKVLPGVVHLTAFADVTPYARNTEQTALS